MPVVDAAQRGRITLVVDQVPQVVQEGGEHEFIARRLALGEFRRLQRMLQLGYRFARVHAGALGREQPFDVCQ